MKSLRFAALLLAFVLVGAATPKAFAGSGYILPITTQAQYNACETFLACYSGSSSVTYYCCYGFLNDCLEPCDLACGSTCLYDPSLP